MLDLVEDGEHREEVALLRAWWTDGFGVRIAAATQRAMKPSDCSADTLSSPGQETPPAGSPLGYRLQAESKSSPWRECLGHSDCTATIKPPTSVYTACIQHVSHAPIRVCFLDAWTLFQPGQRWGTSHPKPSPS